MTTRNKFLSSNFNVGMVSEEKFRKLYSKHSSRLFFKHLQKLIMKFCLNLGQNGSRVIHQGADIKISKQRFGENNFDILASEKIPLDRSINDPRLPECLDIKYDENLPSTTVVIIFYDEAPSVILRTVVSVLNRSPLSQLQFLASLINSGFFSREIDFFSD